MTRKRFQKCPQLSALAVEGLAKKKRRRAGGQGGWAVARDGVASTVLCPQWGHTRPAPHLRDPSSSECASVTVGIYQHTRKGLQRFVLWEGAGSRVRS